MISLDTVYFIEAIVVAMLLIYVMQKTEKDRINKVDSSTVQWLRRLAFCAAAIVLLYSTSSVDLQLSRILLVGASAIILAVNALALHMRAPPRTGSKVHNSAFSFAHFKERLNGYFHPPR